MRALMTIAIVFVLGCTDEGSTPSVTETLLLDLVRVESDGSGDAPTIAAALERVAPGGVIELSDGIHAGDGNHSNILPGGVTVRSVSGVAEHCIIDCFSQGRAFTVEGSSDPARLQSITIRNGRGEWEIRTPLGGAVSIAEGELEITGCRFVNDRAAGNFRTYGPGDGFGGGVEARGGRVRIEECVFLGCGAEVGSAIAARNDAVVTVRNSTIASNRSFEAAVACLDESTIEIENSIIVFENGGAALRRDPMASLTVSCSDIFGNTSGDTVPGTAEDNIAADPEFVDLDAEDVSLLPSSPCSESASPCGRMGVSDD